MNNTASPLLIGFDLRRRPDSFAEKLWPKSRRDMFLLDSHIPYPLSVDSAVWPSLFKPQDIPPHYAVLFAFDDLIELEEGDAVDDLWHDLEAMRASYHRLGATPHGIEIAVRYVTPIQGPRAEPPVSIQVAASPRDIAGVSLGYDVADGVLTSGLSNCVYTTNDKAALQLVWAPKLNQFGLFTDASDAAQFRTNADQRVPEHAPFHVFELIALSTFLGLGQ